MVVEREQPLDERVAIDAAQLRFEGGELIAGDGCHDDVAVVQGSVEIEEDGLNHKGIANSPMIKPVL